MTDIDTSPIYFEKTRCPCCGQECVSVRQYPNGHTYVHESPGGLNLHFCYVREAGR